MQPPKRLLKMIFNFRYSIQTDLPLFCQTSQPFFSSNQYRGLKNKKAALSDGFQIMVNVCVLSALKLRRPLLEKCGDAFFEIIRPA